MSQYSDTVDAWLADLQANVTGLDTTTVPAKNVHLYGSWSFEDLSALQGERHLALWPIAEAEAPPTGLTVGTIGGVDLAEQHYVVAVWEDASAESSRGFDDDTANKAWLTLAEGIRARFYVRANISKGDATIMETRYAGQAFGASNGCRTLEVRFVVRIPHAWT